MFYKALLDYFPIGIAILILFYARFSFPAFLLAATSYCLCELAPIAIEKYLHKFKPLTTSVIVIGAEGTIGSALHQSLILDGRTVHTVVQNGVGDLQIDWLTCNLSEASLQVAELAKQTGATTVYFNAGAPLPCPESAARLMYLAPTSVHSALSLLPTPPLLVLTSSTVCALATPALAPYAAAKAALDLWGAGMWARDQSCVAVRPGIVRSPGFYAQTPREVANMQRWPVAEDAGKTVAALKAAERFHRFKYSYHTSLASLMAGLAGRVLGSGGASLLATNMLKFYL